MLIRNIGRKTLRTSTIVGKSDRFAMPLNNPLCNGSLRYGFSKKYPIGPEEEPEEEKTKILTMNYRKLRKQIYESDLKKNLEMYVNKLGSSNRMYESRMMKKFRTLSTWINSMRPLREENEESKEQLNKEQRKKGLIFGLASYVLLFYFGYQLWMKLWSQIKESETYHLIKRPEDVMMGEFKKQQIKQDPDALKQMTLTLQGVTKVYVIEKKKQYDQTKQQKNDNMIPASLSVYKIILQHQNGRKQMLDPYYGDPNILLSTIQIVRKMSQKNGPASVFYDTEDNFTFKQALHGAFQFLTPFIGVAITLYIFRMNDPQSMLRSLGMGKNNFKVHISEKVSTKFGNVIGMKQAKRQVAELIDFLKNGQKYQRVGAKIPKGALLTGPPGTGKTMLARACAGQANVAFFSISGSEFVEVFVGVGASKVRDIFAQARAQAPSIIFIDQIDAIGKKRENSRNEEKDSTLNQLLVQMDGFSSRETVIVLAATNRKDTLDSALTRPGRFDRMVEINLPDVHDRKQIFYEYLVLVKTDPFIGTDNIARRLAELTPGFSGADIKNLVNEAAIIATRKKGQYIKMKDFEEASERITAGYVKKNLMNKQKRKRVAYHEAGHAVAGWFLKGGDPLLKLTIIPRSKGALGYAQYVPKNSHILSKDAMIDRLAIMLGGITSEQIFFGQMSSGGSDDLQKVYDLTRRMVAQFGMGKQTYNMTLDMEKYVQKQSIYLSDLMDEQMFQILEEAKIRSRNIITEKKEIIENLATQLLQKQTLNQPDVIRIMGERPDFGEPQQKQQPKRDDEEQQFTKRRKIYTSKESPIY